MSVPTFAIDTFSVFNSRLWLSGWLYDNKEIGSITLRGPGLEHGEQILTSYGRLESEDVERDHGRHAQRVRFNESFELGSGFAPSKCELLIHYSDGDSVLIPELGAPRGQRAPALPDVFAGMLQARQSGSLLEIGSRARSGVTRRAMVPAGWSYTGLDIMEGPNVDRVGDAHELSRIFPIERFDAVMAFSVLEHLLMPWKFVIDLNAIMNDGALGVFTTHQCWPIHDAPWDFWRFSDQAWDGLLNKSTGFEIIERNMGEPAFVVAQRVHTVTDFGTQQGGWLASNVLFRRIGPTTLRWDVPASEVVTTSYPAGEVAAFQK